MSEPAYTKHIDEQDVGQRIDVWLARELEMPRSRVHKAIQTGSVTVNGSDCRKNYVLRANDYVVATVEELPELKAEATPADLDVVYEDDDIIIVNKPVGMSAHTAHGWEGPTVVGALLAQGYTLASQGEAYRQGIVHRLDAATTGLMVVARTQIAYDSLHQQFQERSVTKIYHALVQGHMPHPKGTIDAPIGRSSSRDFRMGVRHDGKPAITHYQVLETHTATDLIEVRLETGRTHQIRVHCSAIHHPCVGDSQYGANSRLTRELGAERQWLHAYRLCVQHPVTGEQIDKTAHYPADLRGVLDKARSFT